MKLHAGLPMLAAAMLLAACGAAAPSQPASSPSTPPAAAAPTTSPAASDPATPSVPPPTPVPATPAPTPAPTPSRTPAAVVPAKPTGATIKFNHTGGDVRVTIAWKTPAGPGSVIRVYGVTTCQAKADPGPCLVPNTPLSAKDLVLLAKAPASARKLTWTVPEWENIGWSVAADSRGTYDSIVMAAYDARGHSRFVILATGEYCSDCTY